MRKIKLISLVWCISLSIFLLTGSSAQEVKAQSSAITTSSLYLPEIYIQVNATAETLPGQNITVSLSLSKTDPKKTVEIEHLNISIYGFLYGKEKILIVNMTDTNVSLSGEYNRTLPVEIPENVWGVAQCEIALTYNVTYEYPGTPTIIIKMPYEDLKASFDITYVENVYLINLEKELASLNDTVTSLNNTFLESFNMTLSQENIEKLNQTYWEYVQKYNELQGSSNELTNLRNVSVILGITTIILLASTVYLLLRKPREY
ncbi:MAG: hypothetical protein ACP5IM_06710 [Candidatus Bathyarchaeia archaeon]|nr:MAG: hypothetical protein C0195_01250 [Candidatus Bathyarchaeota archaeon]